MGKVVAITGAAGYLGSVLIAHLESQPWVERIIALDISPVQSTERTFWHYFDVRDASLLRGILGEHDVTHLVHAAFVPSRSPDDYFGATMHLTNVRGSQNVALAAFERGLQQLIFLSSAAVYGFRAGMPAQITEATDAHPSTEYGSHVLEVEEILRDYAVYFPKTRLTILRSSLVAGPVGHELSTLRHLAARPFFFLSNSGRAHTQAMHEADFGPLVATVIANDVAGTLNCAPNDHASWAEISKLSLRPAVSLPRSVLNFAAHFNTTVSALNGLNRDLVDMFSHTLVTDNAAIRRETGWTPRYTTLDAFRALFGGPQVKVDKSLGVSTQKQKGRV